MLLATLPMTAAPVDALAAGEAASRFVAAQGSGGSKIQAVNPAALRLAYRQPSAALPEAADYYVFATGGGFVIVAGDDRAQAVLAYGDGLPDMAALPCNLNWMLNHYAEQMEWLHTHPAARVEPQFTSSRCCPALGAKAHPTMTSAPSTTVSVAQRVASPRRWPR